MKIAFFVARWLILGALAVVGIRAEAAADATDAAPQAKASATASGKSHGKKAAGKKAASKGPSKGQSKGQSKGKWGDSLSRDMVFDGSTINGKYLSAGEATSTVEQEKKMNDLIGVRANFNDRMKTERQRLGSR